MAIIRKYLENSNPEKGCITHKDQEICGLAFRKVCRRRDGSAEQMIIEGEEVEINEFIARNPQISEITEKYLGKILKTEWPPEQQICSLCGQQYASAPPKIDDIKEIQLGTKI